MHLWGYGTNDEELKTSVRKGKDEAWLNQSMTYKLTCCDFGATRSNEKSEVMRRLSNLVPGAFEPRSKVSLDQPRVEFLSMEVKSTVQIDLGFQGVRMFFGRVVGKDKSRKHLNLLDLKKRRYLGPTSMEANMSLIMCNMIKAERERGGPVLDPFCGTGSVLLAAAELGCFTCGFEIDPRVLEFGKVDAKTGQKLDVITNFKDYGFNKPIFLIRGDVHKSPLLKVVEDEVESRCRISGSSDGGEKFAPLDLEKIEKRIKQMEGAFQGIVADPPYGIRERGRKSQFGGKRGKTEQDMINIGERFDNHIPSTVNYPLSEIMDDLMDLSAKTLPVGGRTCFFLPADVQQTNPETDFPSHPCLRVVAHSLQNFSPTWGRRLVTYEKIEPFDIHKHLENVRTREHLRRVLEQDVNYLDLTERVKKFVFADEKSNERKKIQRDIIRRACKEHREGVTLDRETILERRERAKSLKEKDKGLNVRCCNHFFIDVVFATISSSFCSRAAILDSTFEKPFTISLLSIAATSSSRISSSFLFSSPSPAHSKYTSSSFVVVVLAFFSSFSSSFPSSSSSSSSSTLLLFEPTRFIGVPFSFHIDASCHSCCSRICISSRLLILCIYTPQQQQHRERKTAVFLTFVFPKCFIFPLLLSRISTHRFLVGG